MNKFKELKVWQKSIDLVTVIYKATDRFPKEEMFGLTSQIRRAAVSIPSNIAEGAGRLSPGDFKHFLNISRGSSFELETQLTISWNLGFLKRDDFHELIVSLDEVQRMITGLQKTIN